MKGEVQEHVLVYMAYGASQDACSVKNADPASLDKGFFQLLREIPVSIICLYVVVLFV